MMKFTHDEFKKHLIDFNNLFKFSDKNTNFKPCDYELWRKIAKAANNAVSVTVNSSARSKTVKTSFNDETVEKVINDRTVEALFDIGGKGSLITLGTSHDGSLGEYFYKILFPFIALEAPIVCSDTVNANATKINANAMINVIDKFDGISLNLETKADKADVDNNISTLNNKIDNILNKIEKIEEKENKTMNTNNKFNFDFGPVTDDQARISLYGIAVKNRSGNWVAYDSKNEEMMDVDVFNITGMNMLYKMPVAINQVAAGDVIIHNRVPMFVVSFNENGKSFNVIDIMNGEEKCILPTRSPFGFNFITKLVSPINFNQTASASNPFGNMLPFMLMNGDNDFDPMMMFMMMGANGSENTLGQMNPMMLMLMMDKNGDNDDMMKYMLMSQMFAAAPVANA